MINRGRQGSINFFIEGKMIASLPIDINHQYEDYVKNANDIILDGMKNSKMKLGGIKTAFWKCIHVMKGNKNLSLADNIFVGQAVLALIKLKQIDADGDLEGILIMSDKVRFSRKLVAQ